MSPDTDISAQHSVRRGIHLMIDAVGVRSDSGGAVVLTDLLQAAARHAAVRSTTLAVARGTTLELQLASGAHHVVFGPSPKRSLLLWWNALGLQSRARQLGVDAILSLNALALSQKPPLFVLFQQQLMFARNARQLMLGSARVRLRLLRSLAQVSCRTARLVFTQADHVRHNLIREFGLHPERVVAIPPDVSWPCTPSMPAPPRRPGLIAYVGSERAHKSVQTLVDALSLVRSKGVRCCLELTLAPEQVPSRAGVLARGRLPRSAVRELLESAEVMVMPSLAETVGLPLLEAMDMGCCVVVADLPYAREVCGDAALYFEPGDAADCAAKLELALADVALRNSLVRRGHLRLQDRRARAPYAELLDRIVQSTPLHKQGHPVVS